MGTGDGKVVGPTKILNNGLDNARLNLVLIAEGFRAEEKDAFDALCDEFVAALQAEPWYPAVGGAINVHRLNVTSTESGADDPPCSDKTVGEEATNTLVATYFDAQFCGDAKNHRALAPGDWKFVYDTLNAALPVWQAGGLIVNTPKRGGSAHLGYRLFATGLGAHPDESWTDIAMHEFGHAAFLLADEYDYGLGDHFSGGEPLDANLTTASTLAALASAKPRWRDLVTPEVPVPTMTNPNCAETDERPNVLPSDTKVGVFGGASQYRCGIYRPAYLCKMKKTPIPFCGVCIQAIAKTLGMYITPKPRMEVVTENGSLLLEFGDVADGLTLYRAFEVRNKRVGFPGTLRVNLGTPSGDFAYAAGTQTSFTLPAPVNEPYTARKIFVAYKGEAGSTSDDHGSLFVTSPDDPQPPFVAVDLHARSVKPVAVNTVLVFDRSGSMSEPTGVPGQRKVDVAIAAGKLYASLLRDDDRVGIVRFNDAASNPGDVVLGLELAGGQGNGRNDAMAKLTPANLSPSGNTSIGGGIVLGSTVLDGAPLFAQDSRALLVLTDGIQNAPPDIATGRSVVAGQSPKQRVFAVGLGLHQLQDSLVQIASVTNGVAQITGDIVGYREFLLQKLYVQILSDVSDEAFVKDPLGVVPPGQRRSTPIDLGEVDVTADFIVVFRPTAQYPKAIRIWLEAPDGTIVRPSDDAAMPNLKYVTAPSHVYFRWLFPAFPDRPEAHVGRWLLWVENFAPVITAKRTATHGAEPFVYSAMCKARSDLRLNGHLTQTGYAPGSAMALTLEPTLYGQPIHLDADPAVNVVRPDGSSSVLSLSRDGDGRYRGTFTATHLVGAYQFAVEVTATSPAGHRVTRFRQLCGLIFLPTTGGGGHGGDGSEDCCREMTVLLRRLLEVVERCCER